MTESPSANPILACRRANGSGARQFASPSNRMSTRASRPRMPVASASTVEFRHWPSGARE